MDANQRPFSAPRQPDPSNHPVDRQSGLLSGKQRRAQWLLPVILWALAAVFLAAAWTGDPQYAFGWVVPLLAVYLFFRRSLPEERIPPGRPVPGGQWVAAAVVPFFAAAWFLGQANPDWRLIGWVLSAGAILAAGSGLAAAGGWVFVRHYGWAVVLLMFAVPWPSAVESRMTEALMTGVAGATVEGLNAFGIPAIRQGNLIEISSGVLGIDQACSGVRSFQATLMTSVFLGEFFGLKGLRRALLVVAGSAIALGLNVVRTFFLSFSAARAGDVSAADRWHDPAGWSVFAASFVLVAAVGAWMGTKKSPIATELNRPRTPAFRVALTGPALLVLCIALGGTEIWYRAMKQPETVLWKIQWPPEESEILDIPQISRDMLRYDRGELRSMHSPSGFPMVVAFFRWDAGRGSQQVLARLHRPELCLPAGGWVLEQDRGLLQHTVAGQTLAFRAFQFSNRGEHIWVFQNFWENVASPDVSEQPEGTPWSGWQERIRNALLGRRGTGHQTLQVAIWSGGDSTEAIAELGAALDALVSSMPGRPGSF